MPSRSYLLENFKILQDSIFNLTEFYKLLFRWFETMGYAFHETEYADIETPDGKQLEIWWVAEKESDAYNKFVITITFLVLGLQKAEIERGGVKSKTNKGSVEMRVTSYVERDYNGKWSTSPFMKSMRGVYDRFIVKERLDRLEGELILESQQLIDEIRSFLALHKFSPS